MPCEILTISQKRNNIVERERSHWQRRPITYRSLGEWEKGDYSLSALPRKTVMFQIWIDTKMAEKNENTYETGSALYGRKYAKHVTLGRAGQDLACNMPCSRPFISRDLIK